MSVMYLIHETLAHYSTFSRRQKERERLEMVARSVERGDKHYRLHAYVQSGGAVAKPTDEGAQTFVSIYSFADGARFAVMEDPLTHEFLCTELWRATMTPVDPTIRGAFQKVYSEPEMCWAVTRKFPTYDAALAAAVIQAWQPVRPE